MRNIKKLSHILKENYYLQSLQEQDPEDTAAPQEQDPNAAPMGGDPNAMGGMDPSMGGDPNAMGGMDPYGMGIEEIKTPQEIGRIYELNKIYYRLETLNRLVSSLPYEELSQVRTIISEAFDIFRLVLNNSKSYKDSVDKVILKYYDFIARVTMVIENFLKNKVNKHV